MLRFVGKRFLMMIPVILGISFIIFTILALTPGDPAQMILGENASLQDIENLREEMGLNEHFLIRYVKYVGNILRFNFGNSYRTGLPVIDEILTRFPNTLALAFFGIGLSVVIGVPIGIVSAVKQYSIFDTVSLGVALIMTSIPAFWLGLMLLLVFALKLGWFPAIGITNWKGFILPSITLAIGSMAVMIRMTRSTMLEVIREDYIRTARAKGASESRIIRYHELRNALLPIITIIGINFGLQMGGAMICETVFSIPGMGSLMITSVRQKDIPMVMASVLFVAIAISLINLLIDILYATIDPRIKSQYEKAKA
jgi:peptide/nickel transport system permease protein